VSEQKRISDRSEADPASTWNLEVMFATPRAWEFEFERLDQWVEPLKSLRGSLHSPAQVFAWFLGESQLDRQLERLYTYAHLRADEDTADTENQGRQARIRARYTEIAGELSWMVPEVLEQDKETLEAWAASEELEDYRYPLQQIIRQKEHTLSAPEETLLSKAGDILSNPQQTYSLLTNADMLFPDVVDDQGQKRELSQGRYVTFLMNRNREVRKRAFGAMYDTYGDVKNTLASTLSGNVKLHNFQAKVRHHKSAVAAALHQDDIPVGLYDNLISSVHDALPTYHKYINLRSRALELPELDMYDMYVPLVPAYDIHVPYEEACTWVLEACRPLGDEYCQVMEKAIRDRWIDVYENRGKRSGAYSSGCYDSNPYILMNYQGTLDHVFTLAHELGHSMHTWLANETQPHHLSSYTIFVAEIASTLNEELLLRYLLKKNPDERFQAYLLNHLCDSFKGTVYRQTMFAEFEKMIHEMDESGTPLTPDAFSEAYTQLNQSYYGPDVKADDRIALEWSRIPHFYYNFYVYKYATSFCASQVFIDQVLSGQVGRDAYLDMLRAGGSAPPLELVRKAGVDLEHPDAFKSAFGHFGNTIGKLETALHSISG